MDDICAATATTGAALLQSDVRTPDVPMTDGVRHIFKQYFDSDLHVTDVRAARGIPLLLGGKRAICDQDLFPSEASMLSDPLYAMISDYGFRWFSAISFRAGKALWVVTMQRTIRDGMFGADEMEVLSSLSQTLTDVATLSDAIGRQSLLGTLNAFEMIKEPALSLAWNGTVLDANNSVAALFDSNFRVRNGRLFLRDRETLEAIEGLLSGETDHRLDPSETPRIFFARRRGRRPLSIKVMPVHGAARSPFLGARLILTFRDLDEIRRPSANVLSRAFSLTASEAKVASMLAGGASPEQISEAHQTSKETVRNQIKAVFGKSGTHRQNEFAALAQRIQD